jgi:hypothetical protein
MLASVCGSCAVDLLPGFPHIRCSSFLRSRLSPNPLVSLLVPHAAFWSHEASGSRTSGSANMGLACCRRRSERLKRQEIAERIFNSEMSRLSVPNNQIRGCTSNSHSGHNHTLILHLFQPHTRQAHRHLLYLNHA